MSQPLNALRTWSHASTAPRFTSRGRPHRDTPLRRLAASQDPAAMLLVGTGHWLNGVGKCQCRIVKRGPDWALVLSVRYSTILSTLDTMVWSCPSGATAAVGYP